MNGQPSGSLQISRVIGSKGWFYLFDQGDSSVACSLLEPITIKLDGDFCNLSTENDTIKLEDSIVENIAFSYGAGALSITEEVNIKVSKITVP